MAWAVWEGGSPAVAQISTFTVTGIWATGEAATLTCGSQSVTFTVAATQTIAAVVAGLVAAWNSSIAGEMAQITASDTNPNVTLTADTGGVPFIVTVSATAAAGALGSQVNTTANSGPYCWDTAGNWSTGAVPVANVDVVFENSAIDCLYGLAQSAVAIDTLRIKQSFTGTLGLPRNNIYGYVEYLPTYLETGVDESISIGRGEGAGSGRIKIAVGNLITAFRIAVANYGSRAETGIPSVLITTGTQSNDTTLVVNKGDVGVAFFAGETAVIDILRVGYRDRISSDATVVCGVGVTPLTTIKKIGGALTIESNAVTVTQTDGELTIAETATVTTLTVEGGTCYYESTGLCGTLIVGGGATVDYRRDDSDRTVTNASIYETGIIYDPDKSVTWSTGIDLQHCRIIDATLDIGTHLTVTPSAI